MSQDPRCQYPWHPIHEANLERTTATDGGGEVRQYRCPHCGAVAHSSIVGEVKQYGAG